MSLQYLLDGYNIVNQIPHLKDKNLEDHRRELIACLERFYARGSRRNEFCVVFDGQPDVFTGPSRGHIRVIFTKNESADDKIKRMVGCSDRKKSIIVVTDDRDIKYSVRALGASVLGVQEFLAKLAPTEEQGIPAKANKTVPQPMETKRISKTMEARITSEMERIWLRKKPGES